MKQIRYKVYSDVIGVKQNTTSIDIKKIPDTNSWQYATELLRNRFKKYRIKINHVGRTVKVEYKNE